MKRYTDKILAISRLDFVLLTTIFIDFIVIIICLERESNRPIVKKTLEIIKAF